jgi:hypothetical protein
MANPIACLIAYFIPITNVCLIAVFTFLGSSVSCYIIALAALSPIPPLIGQASGEILMVSERRHKKKNGHKKGNNILQNLNPYFRSLLGSYALGY